METAFDRAFTQTIGIEGEYSNQASDAGGATRYGITQAVAREAGYAGDMRELPLELAKQIAKRKYWDILKLDDVGAVYDQVAIELFDTAYNCGPGVAGQFLQRSLNAFNHQAKDYPDIGVDGAVGTGTISALEAFAKKRGREGGAVLLRAIECLKGARYIAITEARPANEDFVFGWILNRISIA